MSPTSARGQPQDPHDCTDEELLARLGSDPAAFTEFYRRHLPAVRTVAVRRSGDPQEVADLVAAVFLKVIESAHQFDHRRGRALPWLYAVAANAAADERRRRGRESAAVARFQGRDFWSEEDLLRIEEQIDAAAAARGLLQAVAALPDAERRLFELVAVDGLATSDAARALGIRVATARMRLSRARRRLRAHLARPSAPAPLPTSLEASP
jgi:RNA polymerase sigma-70 factor (ECF subfamily)